MIIAIEGASAAGKTTWCRRFAGDRVLFEGEPVAEPPPAGASDPHPAKPRDVAEYWGNENARRWTVACALSDHFGWVACDTDPFKLHWTWTLWVEGLAPSDYWETSREACRSAFADGRLGLPDLVFFADLDAETLRYQKAADPTRTRGRHEMHVRISRSLRRWYSAMARLDPSRVEFRLPANGLGSDHLALGRRRERSGVAVFDRFMAELAAT